MQVWLHIKKTRIGGSLIKLTRINFEHNSKDIINEKSSIIEINGERYNKKYYIEMN